MLTGKELGAAIEEALKQNNKTKADAARHFGVAPPSITGWIKTGRISKDNFDKLRVWLVNTPSSHWGATAPPVHQAAVDQIKWSDGDSVYESVAEAMTLLHDTLYGLSEQLQPAGRSVFTRWVNGDVPTTEAANTLDALTRASKVMK